MRNTKIHKPKMIHKRDRLVLRVLAARLRRSPGDIIHEALHAWLCMTRTPEDLTVGGIDGPGGLLAPATLDEAGREADARDGNVCTMGGCGALLHRPTAMTSEEHESVFNGMAFSEV